MVSDDEFNRKRKQILDEYEIETEPATKKLRERMKKLREEYGKL